MNASVTPRESQIWAMMVQGYTKKEIASELDRSVHTVNQLVRQLYDKLDIRKETDLVREWFVFHTFITRDELAKAIRSKAAPVALMFLIVTGVQMFVNAPAVRVVRPVASRTITRTPSQGRRKQDFYA